MVGTKQYTITIELPNDVSKRLQRIARRRKWTIAQHVEALLVLEARIAETDGVETMAEVFKKRADEGRSLLREYAKHAVIG